MIYILVFIFGLFFYNYYQISRYKINDVELESKKISKDLNIIQISDFHSSRFVDYIDVVKDIKKYKPDIIVLTGDMIDGKNHKIDKTLRFVDCLLLLNIDMYFVVGNHEYRNSKNELFIEYLRDNKVDILENKSIRLEEYNCLLAGVNFGVSEDNYDKVTDQMDEGFFNILLSHSPKYPINYSKGREDLIISGHTHGGQIRLPFVGAILSPSEGFFPKYDKGIFYLGETILYIDSGLGTSALPLRFFNRAQITNINIKTSI